MKEYINKDFPHFLHGGDYNPEQWKEYKDILAEDMILMKKAGCNEMTVGIFSWAYLEPKEGEFDFSFLDEVIERIYQNGGRVILATPSGSRPHWLVEKYPEVMRVNAKGERLHFRDRHNHCYTSIDYRRKVAEMDFRLAARYGKHPAVIAWHISNEYGGECYCPACRKAFTEYLRRRYHGDIEALNREYWSGFWSLKYDNFEQIEPPTEVSVSALNALYIDWQRFVSFQTADFMQAEIDAVRKGGSTLPVTTNMMWKHHLNYWALAEKLDFVSWDAYPDWKNPLEEASEIAFWHDLFRSLKKRPFLMMESAPGLVNWKPINRLKRPNVDKLQSLQAIAHGSDSVQYFQFRKGRGGKEKFHGAVVDHLGTDETRLFKVVADIGDTLKRMDEICGTPVFAKVAIVYDRENSWAIEYATGFNNRDKAYTKTCENYHKALWGKGVNVDIINADGDFSKYDLILLPMLYSISEKNIRRIAEYVKAGGVVYATYMTGMVNENDCCYLNGYPAAQLKEVFGIWNEEIDSLYPDEKLSVEMSGRTYLGCDYCENVHLRGAKKLATVRNDFGEFAALTVHDYGKGRAYYQAFRDEGDFKSDVLELLLKEVHLESEAASLPEGTTVHTRECDDTVYLFAENYSAKGAQIALKRKFLRMDTGEEVDSVWLDPLSICVLKRKKNK